MNRLFLAAMAAMMIACTDTKQSETFCFDEMTYSPSETVFKLFAPPTAQCSVIVGADTIAMTLTDAATDSTASFFTATASGDRKGQEYQFLVSTAEGEQLLSPGVFAKAVTINGEKGVVVDMRDSDPEGWADDHGSHPQAYADWIIYELHHRDFSIFRSDASHPGKFLALAEPWAIKHLTELGINAVHILPSYDFGSIDETRLDEPQYNWGYDPVNYNVPEGSYSTDPADPLCRVSEFKQMVQALHRAGINVILDVVYNHTYHIARSNFQRTYPDYYYRKNVGDNTYSNGSGCGNETASEQPMMRQFMIESVKHWINEYHIDGFRFDLMGCHDIETMNQIRQAVDAIDSTIFIYGEGWSAGQCALPSDQLGTKANIPQMPRIAAFSDDIRDALRGPFSDDTRPGWLGWEALKASSKGLSSSQRDSILLTLTESLKAGIAGMIQHPQVDYALVNYSDAPYAIEPTQMIAYVSCHDDMCLVDRLKESLSPDLATLIRLDLLAQTAVFTSQGVPFMLSGEELLRSKQGVHNSFESPDSINRLDWANLKRYPQVFDYYKSLIALRRSHPAFRLGSADLVRSHLEFLSPSPNPSGLVAYRLKDHAGGDSWQDIIVILNSSRQPQTITVPDGTYTVVCREGTINLEGMGTVSSPSVTVAPQSALIIHN